MLPIRNYLNLCLSQSSVSEDTTFSSSIQKHFTVGITWSDAPTEQFASLGTDYKLKCKVEANPPANIDWLKESVIISTGKRKNVVKKTLT